MGRGRGVVARNGEHRHAVPAGRDVRNRGAGLVTADHRLNRGTAGVRVDRHLPLVTARLDRGQRVLPTDVQSAPGGSLSDDVLRGARGDGCVGQGPVHPVALVVVLVDLLDSITGIDAGEDPRGTACVPGIRGPFEVHEL